MLTAVIPWPWRALAIVLLCAASGVIGWLDGAQHAGTDALARELDTAQAVAERVQVLQLQARTAEQRHAQALADVSTDYQRRINEANHVRAADRAALRAGTLRLRDPDSTAAGCGDPAAQAGAGAAGRDGRAPGELSAAAAGFLLELASDADDVARQLAACQRVVEADRQ